MTISQDWLDGAQAVTIDNRGAGHQLIRALIDEGQTRFAFLGGPSDLVTSLERRAGLRTALGEVGPEPVLEMEHAFTSEGGYSSVRDLLSQTSADDLAGMTLIAANDVMALGAIAALRYSGLSVPDDVRVAGFDDIPNLRDFSPGPHDDPVPPGGHGCGRRKDRAGGGRVMCRICDR